MWKGLFYFILLSTAVFIEYLFFSTFIIRYDTFRILSEKLVWAIRKVRNVCKSEV